MSSVRSTIQRLLQHVVFRRLILIITSAVITLSAFEKFFRVSEKVETLTKTNFIGFIDWLGIADVVLLAVFLLPITRKIGFVFSACYYSGALAIRISANINPAEPFLILTLLFASVAISHPEVFFILSGQKPSAPK